MRWRSVAISLVVAGMAGCFGEGPSYDDGLQDALEPAPTSPAPVVFECGQGTLERRPGVCVRRLDTVAAQWSEPALARDAERPDVLALGVHRIGAPDQVDARPIAANVITTEDGGTTWTTWPVPMPASPAGAYFSDPAVAFTPGGRLHFAGMTVAPGVGNDVFHAWSDDLGASWSTPTVFTNGGQNDREWLAVGLDGTLYLSWQVVSSTTHVAWSGDGGRTWERLAETPAGCYTGSPVAILGGEPWIACSGSASGEFGVDVFRLDRASARLTPVSHIGMGCIAPRLLEAPGGAIVATCYGGFVARSADGGLTWSEPLFLRDLLTVEDDWSSNTQVYWSATDGNALHVLVGEFHRVPQQQPFEPHRLAHALLDATTLAVVQETRLTPEGPENTAGPPISLVPPLGDDWYGMVVGNGTAIVPWTWAGGIDLATLRT